MDGYIEYMVRKKSTGKDVALKTLIIIGALLIFFVAMLFMPLLGQFFSIVFMLCIGMFYGAYYLIGTFNLEFEYCLVNGDMDIDKIVSQKKRKRLITVKCSQVETIGKFSPEKLQNPNIKTKIIACDSTKSEDVWYVTLHHQKLGHTIVLFNGAEKILSGIKTAIPKQLAFDVFGRR